MKNFISLLLALFIFAASKSTAQQSAKELLGKADSFYLAGNYKKAIGFYEAVKKTNGTEPGFSFYNKLGISYFNENLFDQASQNFSTALLKSPPQPFVQTILVRNAKCRAMMQDTSSTMDLLQQAFTNGYGNLNELEGSPFFNTIRNNERFTALCIKVKEKFFPCRSNKKYSEFDFWIGRWDVFQSGANYKVGTNTITKETGACSLIESWSSVLGSEYGTSINFLNESTQTWEQVYISSRGKKTTYYNGILTGSKMVFEYKPVKSTDTNKILGRFVFEKIDDNMVRQYQEESTDDGKTWNKLFDFVYRRQSENK